MISDKAIDGGIVAAFVVFPTASEFRSSSDFMGTRLRPRQS